MNETEVIQGRQIRRGDVALIRDLMRGHPEWGRSLISQELCRIWDWRTAKGHLKDMACRSLLRKLQERGHIELPPLQSHPRWVNEKRAIRDVPHQDHPIEGPLSAVSPIEVVLVDPARQALFECLLARYHYLGFHRTVGENMKYLVLDCTGRPLACLLFGSAAWKSAPRDRYIGWTEAARAQNLSLVTNNMRFLILPWVRVPHLASHILGRVARRISSDWQEKYGHPVYLLETFVDKNRFRGTCYLAANWQWVGLTKGRGRNDRTHIAHSPLKDVYLYPLTRRFREVLCHEA